MSRAIARNITHSGVGEGESLAKAISHCEKKKNVNIDFVYLYF